MNDTTRVYKYDTVQEMLQANWAESALELIISTLFLNTTMSEDEVKATVEEMAPKFMEATVIYFGNEAEDWGTKFEFKTNERVNDFNSWMTKVLALITFINAEGIRFERINDTRNGFISGEWEIHI